VRVGDQVIDVEPTGGIGCASSPRNVFMRGLTLRRGTPTTRPCRGCVRSVAGSPLPPLEAGERIANLRVLDSVIERVAGSGPGSAILLRGPEAARPADVLLSGVRVIRRRPNLLSCPATCDAR
jgi:hypothetical protein